MKSLVSLHEVVLGDIAEYCSVDVHKDRSYLLSRWEKEGDSFVTITLPTFAKALELSVSVGRWQSLAAPSFRHRYGLPLFLRGFLTAIFSARDGVLLPHSEEGLQAFQSIRQFCLLTQKVERDCTPNRIAAAFDQYVLTESELLGLPSRIPSDLMSAFERESDLIFRELLQECDNSIANFEVVPRHGPGAVAESLSPKAKWQFPNWPGRLDNVFPSDLYLPRNRRFRERLIEPWDEPPSRVVSVPKTQRTPRIIAIEPTAKQFAQQGLFLKISELIDSDRYLSNSIGMRDQSRNREMAKLSSLDGSLATLDLSEASDRVHWWLVYRLTHKYPHLWDYIWASRSHTANVPSHGVIPLQKFASMGSALTFPFETMIFFLIARLAVKSSFSGDTRKLHDISCYGDDIIVPTGSAATCISYLEAFGFKVNNSKSFLEGNFRESCGGDYYHGCDVTVARLRRDFPHTRRDATNIASLVSTRNELYLRGYWRTVMYLDEVISRFIPLVRVKNPSGTLCLITSLDFVGKTKWSDLHISMLRAPVLIPKPRIYSVDDEEGLWAWFLDQLCAGSPTADRLEHVSQERPIAFNIYNRWVRTDLVLTGFAQTG